MPLKLPRTIRLDPSDTFVFARAAEPGEWAVSGAFLFWDRDVEALAGQERQAFRAGLLGIDSFGWSTLAVVAEATETQADQAVETLAAALVQRLGAPGIDAARAAAEEEIAFSRSLCEHDVGTILAVERRLEADGIRERFRTLHGRADLHAGARAFSFVEGDDETPTEHVDLHALGRGHALGKGEA